MITNNDVLSAAYNRYKTGTLKTKHFTESYRHVFRWLIRYYAAHRKAPNRTIQQIYDRRKHSLNAETQELVEEYLDALAEEWDADTDTDFVRKEILPDFIRERELSQRIDKAQAEISLGKFEEAEKVFSSYSSVGIEDEDEEMGAIIPYTIEDVEEGMTPDNAARVAFNFHGDLDRLIGPLQASWLVAITGIEKSGKSYVLQDMAYEAALYQKKKVLVINLELSKPIARNRLWRRISRTTNPRYAGKKIILPVLDCENNQFGTCKRLKRLKNKVNLFRSSDEIMSYYRRKNWVVCNECRDNLKIRKNAAKTRRFVPTIWFKENTLRKLSEVRIKQAIKNKNMNRLSNLRVKCFPRFSVTFDQTYEFILRYIDRKKWKPDIIVYDYLDILANETGLEGRFDIDSKWKKGSKLAGELDCLVLTADQSTKAGRTQYALDQMSTSESKTKDSHLDARIAINQTDTDRALNLARFNVLFHRHEAFNPKTEVLVTQRLATAQPMMDNAYLFDKAKNFRVINTKF
jgi:replicative DNA helicase